MSSRNSKHSKSNKNPNKNINKNLDQNPEQVINDQDWDDVIFNQKPVRNKQGGEGGAGDLYSTATPYTNAMAANNPDKNFAPAADQQLVNQLSQAAQASLDSGYTPSPFGSTSPNDISAHDPEPFVRNPNANIQSYSSPKTREVLLKANIQNAYITSGFINYKPVEFLVDTGATSVSIPYRIADALGLQPSGRKGKAQTANGMVTIYETRLDKLQIGDIILEYVDATINMGDKSDHILLGMSALKQLEIVHKNGQLLLRQHV